MAIHSLAKIRWLLGLGAGFVALAACGTPPSSEADPAVTSASSVESSGGGGIIRGPACGSAGQACCANSSCGAWATCSSLLDNPSVYECFGCGGLAQPACTTGAACQTGLSESYSFCTNDCGGYGQGCCSGTMCNVGVCNANKECEPAAPPPCGGYGERCCSGGCASAFLECVGGTCSVECGFYPAQCCAGYACYDGSSCQNQFCLF